MTDAGAQLLWWRDQTPFGQTVDTGGFSQTPIRFPGQFVDDESGLHYNYFRDYDPALGRYIQSDPIGLRGGLNTYGYVNGNPLRYVDPTGEVAIPLLIPLIPYIPAGAQFARAALTLGTYLLLNEAVDDGDDAKKKGVEAWNKNPPKKRGLYTCRYVMYFPSDLCESGECPRWVTGRGYDVTLSGAMSQARNEAQSKIPPGCGHQHHGQMWCRRDGGPPFMP